MQSQKSFSALTSAAVLGALLASAGTAVADGLPAIKTSASNAVPVCVTPGRLQAYLEARNPGLETRFQTIAIDYMREGDALAVRWDYAFFQMIMETGQLSFKNGNRAGDVKPTQNNFAGLGATGGVPGESFPDVATGVRAHLQHVLLYAGEKLENPVAERTRKVQEWGVLTDWHKGIKQPITYADLASKWAPKSRAYVDNLEQIAEKFFSDQCKKADPHPEYAFLARGQAVSTGVAAVAPAATPLSSATSDKISGAELARKAAAEPDGGRSALGAATGVTILNAPVVEAPSVQDVAAASPPEKSATAVQKPVATKIAAIGAQPKALAAPAETPAMQLPQGAPVSPAATLSAGAPKCRVWTASYGGQRAVIVKSVVDSISNFTVLDVNEGQEAREAEAFIAAYAKGGTLAGEFATQNKALEKAFELCPEG